MALNKKISELTEKASIVVNDYLPIVDSEAEPIETKKIKFDVIYDLFALVGHNHAGVYEPVINPGVATQYWRGDKAWATLNQAAVAGLGTTDDVTHRTLLLSDISTNRDPVLSLLSERAWYFGFVGSGAATYLKLYTTAGNKYFYIRGLGDANVATFALGSNEASSILWPALSLSNITKLTANVADTLAGGLEMFPVFSADAAKTITRMNYLNFKSPSLSNVAVTYAPAMRFDAALGTHKASVGSFSITTGSGPGGVPHTHTVTFDGAILANFAGTLFKACLIAL